MKQQSKLIEIQRKPRQGNVLKLRETMSDEDIKEHNAYFQSFIDMIHAMDKHLDVPIIPYEPTLLNMKYKTLKCNGYHIEYSPYVDRQIQKVIISIIRNNSNIGPYLAWFKYVIRNEYKPFNVAFNTIW